MHMNLCNGRLSVFSKQVMTPPTHPTFMLVLSHPITTTSSVIFLSFITSMIDVAISVALLDDGIVWVRYFPPGSVRTTQCSSLFLSLYQRSLTLTFMSV